MPLAAGRPVDQPLVNRRGGLDKPGAEAACQHPVSNCAPLTRERMPFVMEDKFKLRWTKTVLTEMPADPYVIGPISCLHHSLLEVSNNQI